MYFPKDLENFGVVLKGASLSKLSKISDNFDHCFIVNNIDKNVDPNKTEYNLVAPNIEGKEIAHFVNRLPTAPLLKKHYLKLNIKHIQFSKTKLDLFSDFTGNNLKSMSLFSDTNQHSSSKFVSITHVIFPIFLFDNDFCSLDKWQAGKLNGK